MVQQNYAQAYGNNRLVQVYAGYNGGLNYNGNTFTYNEFSYTWTKPKGSRLTYFWVVGGGGGGGGGVGTNGGGGGGGGSGGVSKLIIPSILLPDTLYVSPGLGGSGGQGQLNNSPTTAARGYPSYVSTAKLNNASLGGTNLSIPVNATLIMANNGNYGEMGNGVSKSPGGAGATALNVSAMPLIRLGIYQIEGGASGGDGGFTPSAASSVNFLDSNGFTTGGAGGGSTNTGVATSGASISLGTGYPPLSGGVTGVTLGGHGSHGLNANVILQNLNLDSLNLWTCLTFTGGAGGGGVIGTGTGTSYGGNGGNGGFGCGGGGGGSSASATNKYGGNGGNGGPGFVMIISEF